MRENPPFNRHYWPTLALVLLALCPNIILTTAYYFITPAVAEGLHSGQTVLHVVEGLSNAGYAFGAIIAGYLTQRFPQRPLFLISETGFVIGCVLCALAPGVAVFAIGRILEGLMTGLLLVIAVPPLVTRFSAADLPLSAAAINIAFFGAVTAGPLIGGAVAASGWRWLFTGLAALALTGLALGVLSLPLESAHNPEQRPDWPAFIYAALGTALPFYAVSRLASGSFAAPTFWAPIAVGIGCLTALIVTQYRSSEGLVPMHKMWHSIPLAGTLCAMLAGAAYVTFLLLNEIFLQKVAAHSPLATGLAQWPGVLGLLAAAMVFWRLFPTRFLPHLIVAGMVLLLAGGAATVTLHIGSPLALSMGISAALGAGAGATVSPGLFMAGFAVESSFLGRVFGLVELVRSETDFLIGPAMEHVAMMHGQSGAALAAGVREAAWVTLGIVLLGMIGMIMLYIGSGARPHQPHIRAWLNEGKPALASPAAKLRLQLKSHG
jgi:MFS family permease